LLNGEARIVDHLEMVFWEEALAFERARHEQRKVQRAASAISAALASEGALLNRRQNLALRDSLVAAHRAGDL
jgi:hypothetical protein